MRLESVRAAIVACAVMFGAPSASADTIKVYAAGAVKAAVSKLIPGFEAKTGHKIEVAYDTVGALRDRLLKGEKADIALLSVQAITEVAKATPAQQSFIVGRTGVGMGVAAGAARPAMATTAEFVAALKAAKTVAYADPARGATAGTHFKAVLTKLGLDAELAPKIRLYPSGVDAIAALARGEVDFASSQGTEIVGREGVTFAGFLPDDIQLWTVYQIARFGASDAATGFAAVLTGPEGKAAFAAIGFVAQ